MGVRVTLSTAMSGIALIALIAAGVSAAPAGAATRAAGPRPATTGPIAQSGSAHGSQKVVVGTDEISESGGYTTTGQLGSGSYFVAASATDVSCDGAPTITATGTASLLRVDGSWLHGTAVVAENCVDVQASPVTLTLTLGVPDHDLVSAHLVLHGTHSHALYPAGILFATTYTVSGDATFTQLVGYRLVGANGTVTGFGGLTSLGNAPTTGVTHLEPTPDQLGYWIVDRVGHVYAFGDARWLGNAPSGLAAGETVTNLSATPSGHGYWLFTSLGRALPFGDAAFLGDMRAVALNGPVIGAIATPTGHGYYMVASDGGVFAFGDAAFHGSMGAVHLNQPVNGLVPTADNGGYWLVASDGGVFSFGDAVFKGSMGAVRLNRPVVGMTRYGSGYVMVGSDGGAFTFTTAPFFGSLGANPGPEPIVGIAATG